MDQKFIMKKDGKSGYSLRKISILLCLAVLIISSLNGCAKKDPVKEPIEEEIVIDPITDFISYVPEPTNKEIVDFYGTKTTEIALKAQYGDLYRWVEPLTENQIEEQFQEIYNLWQLILKARNENERIVTLIGHEFSSYELLDPLNIPACDKHDEVYKAIYETNSAALIRFKPYMYPIFYEKSISGYDNEIVGKIYSSSWDDLLGAEQMSFSLFEKEVFVRDMRAFRDFYKEQYDLQGVKYECTVCEAGSK